MGIGLVFDEYVEVKLKPPATADEALQQKAEMERNEMFPMSTAAAWNSVIARLHSNTNWRSPGISEISRPEHHGFGNNSFEAMNNGSPQKAEQPANASAGLDDSTLIRRFVNCRDESAFAELVGRYRGLVYGVAQRVLHQQQDVEDAFQATFLVLARDAAGIRNRASIAGWLYGVAYRLALKARGRKQRRAEQPFRDETMNHADPFAELAERSDLQVLDEELNGLPEKYREPLVRHYLMGRTAPQIADDMQLSVSAIEGRLKRGRDRLRTRLTRRGVGFAVVLGALEICRQSAEACVADSLVAHTVSAGLSYSASGQSTPLYSQQAAQLAAKEIGTMTTTSLGTATALTLTATLIVGLAIGLSGQTLKAEPTREEITAPDGAKLHSAAPKTADDPPVIRLAEADPVKAKTAAGKQQPKSAASKRTRTPRPTLDYRKRSVAEERIHQELSNKTQIDFVDTSLKDCLEFLAELHNITILIDDQGLDNAGVKTDAPVNLALKDVALKSILRIILDRHELDYLVRNEVLEITSKKVANSHVETHVYELRHLAHIPAKDLVTTIRETVRPETWRTVDNGKSKAGMTIRRGSITAIGGALVVTHTQRANEDVMDLLEQLARHAPRSKWEKEFDKELRRQGASSIPMGGND